MAHKDDEHPSRDVVSGIEALEWMSPAVAVQYSVVFYRTEGFRSRDVVVGLYLACEIGGDSFFLF